jgi:hypothetical protein
MLQQCICECISNALVCLQAPSGVVAANASRIAATFDSTFVLTATPPQLPPLDVQLSPPAGAVTFRKCLMTQDCCESVGIAAAKSVLAQALFQNSMGRNCTNRGSTPTVELDLATPLTASCLAVQGTLV